MNFVPHTAIKPIWVRRVRSGCIFASLVIMLLLGQAFYSNYLKQTDETNIATLNEKVWAYKEKLGTPPDLNLVDLYHHGLTKERIHRTPFGGYYRLDPKQLIVYNPNFAGR
jgi:hypothetical protein